MNKITIVGIVVLIVGGIYVFAGPKDAPVATSEAPNVDTSKKAGVDPATEGAPTIPTPGKYQVIASDSSIAWSAKKPLIDGYVNSGTLDVGSGQITVGDNVASGSFTIDMSTLTVGLTAAKPGKEGTLEEHLEGERFFDVANFPTATFTITSVAPRADSATTNTYDVTGDLTMKGVTNSLTFPATIAQRADGKLVAEAAFEMDRTKWGITMGSANFFQNLGDNMIDDMVALSFSLVAEKAE